MADTKKVLALPTFRTIHNIRIDKEANTIAFIFESDTHEYFQAVFSSELVVTMIPTLLEKTPPDPSFETSVSFAAPVKRIRSGILEGGEPTLGIFFPSGIPISLLLDNTSISSLISTLKELQSMVDSKGHDKSIH